MNIIKIKQFLVVVASLCLSAWASADTYTYDNLNRLTSVVYSSGSQISYSYDAAGNRASMTSGALTAPDPFIFTPQTNVALNTQVASNAITVSGINAASPITVTGGEYSISGGAYASAPGNVTNGQAVTVRLTSAGTYSTLKSATLTIGGVSASFNVTTAATDRINQTIGAISFLPNTLAVGGTTVASATATSGLAVSFSSTTPSVCTVSGSTVNGVAIGTCTVAANRAGDGTYNAAPQVTQNITINRVSQTIGAISFAPNALNVGGTTTASATATSGLAVSLSSTTPSVCTVSGSTVNGVAAGTCTVAANQAGDGTYNVAPQVTQNITIAAPASRLTNISTRGQVQTGDDVMIGGFVIASGTPKTLLIRARGPSLSDYGVPGALDNPVLRLYSGPTMIASNDNWGDATNAAAIQATGVAPSNPLESAILTTLNPGNYTAIVTGAGGGSGVGIVETFEIDNSSTPLVNLSTRGQVQTGDKVMIGGFVITGSSPQTVLVRARGPSLSDYGVPGVLANPAIQLYSGSTVIASNDNWGAAANAAAIQATGLAPSNPYESAILITLQPGAYTVIVSGADGGTGVGIVEVFAQ